MAFILPATPADALAHNGAKWSYWPEEDELRVTTLAHPRYFAGILAPRQKKPAAPKAVPIEAQSRALAGMQEANELRPLEEDRALLDAFRAGDREALAEVFRRYLPLVMRSLRGGARVTAEGPRLAPGVSEFELEALAQETFLRAFAPGARERYDGLRPYAAYIATIAKNLLIDAARRRGRTPSMVALDDVPQGALSDSAAGSATDTHLEAQALAGCLATFVEKLDPDEREVYRTRFEQQLSLRAAAKTTGRPLFALRKIDARLRMALLADLREAGFLEETPVAIGTSVLNERRKRNPRGGPDES